MVRTAYLRVYEPVSAFAPEEQAQWLADPPEGEEIEQRSTYGRWLVTGGLPEQTSVEITEGAFFRRIDDVIFVCPWRTRLRILAGLLAFRDSVPAEVADAFVPEAEARRAAAELALLDANRPDIRSHILHANWHVPLRWFAAFDGTERILTEDRNGLRIRYETRVLDARNRIEHMIGVLEESWGDEGVIGALRELGAWLELFSGDAVLELDYSSVAGMFTDDELVEDNCAAEIWACVEAIGSGDARRAAEIFGDLTDRWATVRAHEVVN